MSQPTELQKGLKQRHLTMIAIGGVIGAGLFVGSGVVIKETGPAAFLSYLVTGVLIILVMRMLGEMATANPSTGSFADYARKALGGWAGFSVAWLYWYFWVIVVGFEAVAGAKILILVRRAAVAALAGPDGADDGDQPDLGRLVRRVRVLVRRHQGGRHHRVPGARHPVRPRAVARPVDLDFTNLTQHGGFLPNGVGAIFSGIVVVIFSMVGAEIATDRRGRVRGPGAGDRQGHQVGDPAGRDLLRRLDVPAGRASCRGTTPSSAPRRTSPPSRRWASRTPTTS